MTLRVPSAAFILAAGEERDAILSERHKRTTPRITRLSGLSIITGLHRSSKKHGDCVCAEYKCRGQQRRLIFLATPLCSLACLLISINPPIPSDLSLQWPHHQQ